MAEPKRCLWCGKPLSIKMAHRKRHPDCAKLYEQSRITAVYAAEHNSKKQICRGCGATFLSASWHRNFCPECNRKPKY